MKYLAIYIALAVSAVTSLKDLLIDWYTYRKINEPHERQHSKYGLWGNFIVLCCLAASAFVATKIQASEDQTKLQDSSAHQLELNEQKLNFDKIVKRLKNDSANLSIANKKLSRRLDEKTETLYKQLKQAGKEYVASLNTATKNLDDHITGGNRYPVLRAVVYSEDPRLTKEDSRKEYLTFDFDSSYSPIEGVGFTVYGIDDPFKNETEYIGNVSVVHTPVKYKYVIPFDRKDFSFYTTVFWKGGGYSLVVKVSAHNDGYKFATNRYYRMSNAYEFNPKKTPKLIFPFKPGPKDKP